MPVSEVGNTPISTIVTACDSNFVWGAMLLGLSLRYNKMTSSFHVLGYDLNPEEIAQLSSIPQTKVFNTHKTSSRSVCTQKPEAIATADTEIIVWMDADCVVIGNIESFFVCPENQLQIRWREADENGSIYRNYYKKEDKWGCIPSRVLKQWKEDVGDLATAQIKTVCQTNCFVINCTHIRFIEKWREQMEKVIPADSTGVYAKKSAAYSMTDESVLNSLFAFYSQAPSTCEYQMDKNPQKACLHFGLNPKPWKHWTRQSLNHYNYIMTLLDWASNNNISLPQLPKSFQAKYKYSETFLAYVQQFYKAARYRTSTLLRKLKKEIR